MRRKLLILVALMLLFCISPVSAYGNESPQSIPSFDETLPDDVLFYPDNETHGSGYAESFADGVDWLIWEGNGLSTDGDVGYFEGLGDNAFDRVYSDSPSISVSGSYYVEVRFKSNVSSTYTYVQIFPLDTHGGSGQSVIANVPVGITWTTYKALVTISDIESVSIIAKHLSVDFKLEIDYLRISPSDEMGWQHDCSTVANTTTLRVDVESDGDHIQFQYSGGGGTGELSFHTDSGGSAIAAIDTDYYPFIGWNVVNLTDDFYEVYVDNTLVYTGTGLGLQHVNVKASGEVEYTTITFVLSTVTESMALDWVKGHSIANFTVSQSGATTDDYLYVDSGILYSNMDDGTIELNHDPVLSVNGATYPIYNLTTSGAAPEFSMYVSEWSIYSAITRGATTSGNITDIKLRFNSNEILSAIKFIEEITMEINIFNELFLSTEMWGYFGPVGLVIIGYLLTKKEKSLGIFMFIVDCLVISHYLTLVDATPAYWWHAIILLLGVILCTIQLIDR